MNANVYSLLFGIISGEFIDMNNKFSSVYGCDFTRDGVLFGTSNNEYFIFFSDGYRSNSIFCSEFFRERGTKENSSLDRSSTKVSLSAFSSRGAYCITAFHILYAGSREKHTMANYTEAGPKLDYSKVDISMWKPVERKY